MLEFTDQAVLAQKVDRYRLFEVLIPNQCRMELERRDKLVV